MIPVTIKRPSGSFLTDCRTSARMQGVHPRAFPDPGVGVKVPGASKAGPQNQAHRAQGHGRDPAEMLSKVHYQRASSRAPREAAPGSPGPLARPTKS